MSDPQVPLRTREVVESDSIIEPTQDEVIGHVREMVALGSLLKTGQVALPDQGSKPRHNFELATVRQMNDGSPEDSEGWVTFEDDPDSDHHLVARQYRSNWGSFSVQFFREGAMDRAKRTRLWLRSELGAIFGDRTGIRVARISPIRNLTGIDGDEGGVFRGRPEERAAFEMWANWEQRILARVERIEGVTIEGGIIISEGGSRFSVALSVDRPSLE